MVARAGATIPSRDELFDILGEVMDPEVPVLSVVELGIVRDIRTDGERVTVVVTPTYSGCPAMHAIEQDIRAALTLHGVSAVAIETVYAPAWTTDWMGDAAKEKLRQFGIAPPAHLAEQQLVGLTRRRAPVVCPYCGSGDTTLQSQFGSTACKAIHTCNACRQPFDEFKAF